MKKSDIKLLARYIILVYFMCLAYILIEPEYVNKIKDIGQIATSAIYGSVFGALRFIIKGHFDTRVSED